MRGIVVGLGSMGKRRIRLMREFFPDAELCGVDSNPERRAEAAGLFGIECYESITSGAGQFNPDSGFVCTSPLSHASIITELLELNLNVFTEINLVNDGYDKNTALAKEKGLTLFLSSTPLYRKEIIYIQEAVKSALGSVAYRYHVGQYLPDWHPWENYKDFFVGDKRTNGCREIFAIELPWMLRVFGDVAEVHCQKAKMSNLNIDYPDTYSVSFRHESGALGQLLVDVVSRKAVRELEIMSEDIYMAWAGSPDTLRQYDIACKQDFSIDTYERVSQDNRYAKNIIENAYVDELAAFFDVLDGKPARMHTFEDDKKVLKLIDELEGELK